MIPERKHPGLRPLRIVPDASMDEPRVTPMDLLRRYPISSCWLGATWASALVVALV